MLTFKSYLTEAAGKGFKLFLPSLMVELTE